MSRLRFWKYMGGVGVTGTLFRLEGCILLLVYYGLALLGLIGIAALIYAVI